MTFVIPIRTKPGLNGREHWRARAARVKRERNAVRLCWPRRVPPPALPVVVRLTRLSPGTRPMDDDNLPGACKAIRDEVAAILGIDDGDRAAARWEYAQDRGPWGIRVEVSHGL